MLDVEAFGAVANSKEPSARSANVSAFRAAFAKAKETKAEVIARTGRAYWLNQSVCQHSCTFHCEAALWFDDGRPDVNAGLIVRGNAPRLNLIGSINSVATTRGGGYSGQMNVCVSATDFEIYGGGQLTGASCVGLYLQAATRGSVRDLIVLDSHADAFHTTGGSSFIDFKRLKARRSHDDMFAVVSYGSQKEGICHHISLSGFDGADSLGGRGLTVVGGEDVIYEDAVLSNVSGFGLYIASEAYPYFTRGVRRVTMRRVAVNKCGAAGLDLGDGILMMGRSGVDSMGQPLCVHGESVRLEAVRIAEARRYGALIYKENVKPALAFRSGVTFTSCGWGNVWREV